MPLFGIPLVVVALTGCASTSSSGYPGMMGGDSQYHSSTLTCSAPTSLPGQTMRVTLGDMGMTQMMGGSAPMGVQMRLQATPTTEPAGTVSLIVSNLGWREHELVVLPLAPGAVAGQRTAGADGKVSENGSAGEVSRSCASGAGTGLTAGTVGWMTVNLVPGHYELVCNLPNHYADGMYPELTVG